MKDIVEAEFTGRGRWTEGIRKRKIQKCIKSRDASVGMVLPLLRKGALGDKKKAITEGEDDNDFGLNLKRNQARLSLQSAWTVKLHSERAGSYHRLRVLEEGRCERRSSTWPLPPSRAALAKYLTGGHVLSSQPLPGEAISPTPPGTQQCLTRPVVSRFSP